MTIERSSIQAGQKAPVPCRVPGQLQRDDLRFIRIPRGSKGGPDNEPGWNTDKNYPGTTNA